ncbi:MAG: SusD/RagB family nutrient-binding outer membrane lipoprotein [Ferruginibacter sp.]
MKKLLYIGLSLAMFTTVLPGCKKSFEDLNNNENKPKHVQASLLFNGVLNDLYEGPAGEYEKYGQYFLQNYDYYGNNRYDFGAGADFYPTLKNVSKMEEEALAAGAPAVNPYSAMASFFKAYFFTKMSLQMGDIPMKEAVLGIENLNPAYDSQKEIMQQAFVWLEKANTDLTALIAAENLPLSGDIYFNNDLRKWQKTVNAYRLRLLINLSKKSGDADLKIQQQFSDIVSNPVKYPLMESSADNLQYNYVYPTNNYPQNPGSFGFDALRQNTSATYVGLLTQLKDPRVFITSDPAAAKVSAGTSPISFDAFVGADPGEDIGLMYIKANSGQYSLIGRKYFYDSYTGEPSIQVGFPEMCFNIAEAINRGWIAKGKLGDAEANYRMGIMASFASYKIPVKGSMAVYFLKPGASLGTYNTYTVDVDLDNYYNQSAVKYIGNTPNGLTQILKQKYLALFRHSGLEGFYQFRRTGVPSFTTGPGTGNSGRIPLRFKYPSSEISANTDHYNEALKKQFGGNDDINAKMWIIE